MRSKKTIALSLESEEFESLFEKLAPDETKPGQSPRKGGLER